MGIAEQMGRMLQRTSISVNIKERLDFSCALFSPAGDLVANAPHVPVHLGAMSEAVRFQVRISASALSWLTPWPCFSDQIACALPWCRKTEAATHTTFTIAITSESARMD